MLSLKWPYVPDFLRQSWFLTTCPVKNHSSPGTPICPVFGLVSRISPDLPISAAACLLISGQKLAQILSVWKNRWRPGLCPGPCWGSSRHSPYAMPDPDGSRLSRSQSTIRTFGALPGHAPTTYHYSTFNHQWLPVPVMAVVIVY